MLRLEQVEYKCLSKSLFSSINLSIDAGECLVIKGINGSGKSTLLKIIAGLIEPHFGDIYWNNKSIYKQKLDYTQQLIYIGHQNALKPNLTAYENMRLLYALSTHSKMKSNIITFFNNTHLKDLTFTPAQLLSQGQQRSLSLMRLLLKKSPLWILDEPTTSLDEQGHSWLKQLIDNHLACGGMAIIATHQKLFIKSSVLHLTN